ncbi:MAG TPA: hypothetical protein PK616_08580, partial [Fibrobacteraceae bacterium]|nr:hypothetical protein [Fibrobacteraceae bacterium]
MDPQNGGIIAFVSNGSWLDGNSTDGFRKAIEKEFSSIWVFNLRGNQRTSGELSRKEGGKIFGSGSRTPISITLLVKNPTASNKKAIIQYHDIGDYLNREEKLAIVRKSQSVANTEMEWQNLQPNEHGDWLNQRNDVFDTFIPMAPEKKFDAKSQSFFVTQSPGVLSSRESWVYNFSKDKVANQMDSMISFYESQRIEFSENNNAKKKVEDYIDTDAKKISWTRALRKDLSNNVKHKFKPNSITEGILRPYYKLNLYNDRNFIESPGLLSQFFPKALPQKNVVICVSGLGANKQNCILAVDSSIDYNAIDAGAKCFPLYYYEEREKNSPSLFDATGDSEYIRRDGVSDFILER